MSNLSLQQGPLLHELCSYGASCLRFRGPAQPLEGDYVAFLGGTETFGRFVRRPYPDLVHDQIAQTGVNLGVVHAGPEAFLEDPGISEICAGARLTVIQIMGAGALSGPHYRVHPRRNDRIVEVLPLLRGMFETVDFSEHDFLRHLLHDCAEASPRRFRILVDALCQAWVARMQALISAIPGEVLLFWFADRVPPKAQSYALEREPLFVTAPMIDKLHGARVSCLELPASLDALGEGTAEMYYDPREFTAAHTQLGQLAHLEAAQALVGRINALLQK
ncbi:DUF6473 family protein [Poseidonocella sedimentorum]|uniref:DUF6473 domain-containing protein n=1 Tax=Poseidonocella sedimentorum TaxID=871652 RepID=A0A1I6EMF5_9RHOB|nr:DUF6473 family protein [Poseidonocella sedimentorum]SFR18731.1 hypothetical protein SAMN04515673_11470 [Poseidonocella sedimentorum]